MFNEKVVCFTGHRPKSIGGYGNNPQKEWVYDVLRYLMEYVVYKHDKITFISGGALGVDQWAAELAIYLKGYFPDNVKLTIARPFPSQAKLWPNASKKHFENICRDADDVVDVCRDPYAGWKMNKRNEWMVDNSDTVIAVWLGIPGGTANCIRYAESKNKNIWRVNPRGYQNIDPEDYIQAIIGE